MSFLRAFRDLLVIGTITLALLEVALRIYNPLYVPLRADKIELPVNRVFKQVNLNNRKVDRELVNTYNAIGLRGPDYPSDPDNYLKIFTVGGSTTACVTLTDGKTWPDILGRKLQATAARSIWLNNAGIDGHSTFGHLILLESHLKNYKPDFIVFLIGINDVGRSDLNDFDSRVTVGGLSWRNRLVANSELLSTMQVLYRTLRAYDMGVNYAVDHDLTKFANLTETSQSRHAHLKQHGEDARRAYRQRAEALVERTRAIGATPVLVTQPALFGYGIDPTTERELGALEYMPGGPSAGLQWETLELYNNVTRSVALDKTAILIDAARQMPKDSRLYFDWIHYSNDGAAVMAEVVYEGLRKHIEAGMSR